MTAQERLQHIEARVKKDQSGNWLVVYYRPHYSVADLLDIAGELAEENKRLAKALLLIETNDPRDFDEEDWEYYDAAVMIAREVLKEDR